jgi:predicted ArsR family transcriptional regulator
MPNPTSRQRVFQYIQSQRAVTAGDISRALTMTPANARHHLDILEQEGLVQTVGVRPAEGRGRPAHIYTISHPAQGNTLAGLAHALLEEIPGGAVQRLAERLAGPQPRPRHLTLRLAALAQRLNELHYQARWEARASGPVVLLENCPYAEIIDQHPELCRMDAALLEDMLDAPVEQRARLERDRRGGRFCMFRVKS